MRSRHLASFLVALVALLSLALLRGDGPEARAQGRANSSVRSFSGSISVSNAAIASTVGSGEALVIRALTASASSAGVLVITDGSGGAALARVYLAANTPTKLTPEDLGAAGIRCSRGTTPYANAISGATLTLTMAVDRE